MRQRQWQWGVVFVFLILSGIANVYLTKQTGALRHQVDTLQAERNTAGALQRQVDALQIQVNGLQADNARLAELVRTLGGNPDARPSASPTPAPARTIVVRPAPAPTHPAAAPRPSPTRTASPRPTRRPSPSPSPSCLLGLVCR